MAIIKCKDCEKDVSSNAEACPNCGAKYPASYIPSKVIVKRRQQLLYPTYPVSVDGRKIGQLKKDETIEIDLYFGNHLFQIPTAIGKTTIEIKPAKTYLVEVYLTPGLWPTSNSHFEFSVIDG